MFFKKSEHSRSHDRLARLHAKVHQKKDFFPGQRENEEVQLCIRTHWLQRAKIFFTFFVLGVSLPGIVVYILSFLNLPPNIWIIIRILSIIYLLFAWLLTFIEFIKSEFTILVATNERIADIVQVSLFDQQISETNLDRIQEVSGLKLGILKTIMDIGRLEIQTAGSDIPLVMQFVKSPHLTARKILDIQKSSQQRRRGSDFGKRDGDKLQGRKGETLSEAEIKKMRGEGGKNGQNLRKPTQAV